MWSHRLKLSRAIEHLYALEAVIERWSAGDACGFVDKCEIQRRQYVRTFEIWKPPSDPLMPLLIGDCAHAVRCALDHLAYQLAILVSGCNPPPNESVTAWPIHDSKPKFDSGLTQKVGSPKRMDPALYAALEGLQPYLGRNLDALAFIERLDNLDKHRFPPVVAGILNIESVNIRHAKLDGPAKLCRVGAVEHGAPVLECPADSEVDMNFTFISAIAFGETSVIAPGKPIVPLLMQAIALVRDRVFPEFEPFL